MRCAVTRRCQGAQTSSLQIVIVLSSLITFMNTSYGTAHVARTIRGGERGVHPPLRRGARALGGPGRAPEVREKKRKKKEKRKEKIEKKEGKNKSDHDQTKIRSCFGSIRSQMRAPLKQN